MVQSKSELRNWAKQKRKGLDKHTALVQALVKSDAYKKANHVMLFYPMKDEVDLLAILDDKTKKFFLPKVDGDDLLCCPYCAGDELCVSCFNTQEPTSNPVDSELIDLVIVPALAVDKNNYRLGYGGGFYDRFLRDKSVTKIVCIPKELIVESVYPEKFDIPVDIVVTA